MGQGYHSRSPEEFKKYLKSLDLGSRKRNWRQIILLVDVVLLVLVFYMVFRALNPGLADNTQSQKQLVEGIPSYLFLSREKDLDFQGYFWFFENKTSVPLTIPRKEWKVRFRILSKEGKLCYDEPLQFPTKTIQPEGRDFLYHNISIAKLNKLPADCRKEIFDINKSFFRSRYLALELGFFAEILLETETERYQFQIKQKLYPEIKE